MKKFALATMLALGLTAGAAQATESTAGPYAGAGVGFSHFSIGDTHLDVDKSNFGFNVYGGYRFNDIVAAEVGYAKLGDIDIKGPGVQASVKTAMISASALAYVPVADNTEVFGRVGVAHTRAKLLGERESGTSALLGVGAEYAINKSVSVRAEVQYVPEFVDGAHLVNSTVSLKARF